jgi:beta-xylosidase
MKNPLFQGADPEPLFAGGSYWIYPTSECERSKDHLYCWQSPDKKTWTVHGPILSMDEIDWIKSDGVPHELWAPGVFASGGKYYLYFAVGPQNPTPSRIGVAVADQPQGPFVDSGKPLVTGGAGFEAIDAMVFGDPATGKTYLYCGGSACSKLKIFELNDDLVSIKGEVAVDTPEYFTEAPYVMLRRGRYYLSYSHGRWNDDSYCVLYATSKSAVGPWKYQGKILETDRHHAGPGHSGFIQDPGSKQWYIVYHRCNGAKTTGKMPGGRSTCIDKIRFDRAGNILPVQMSRSKVR